jgi:hypothetical protein
LNLIQEDVPLPSLAEIIALISDSWECGLQENMHFRELISQIQTLVLEHTGEVTKCTRGEGQGGSLGRGQGEEAHRPEDDEETELECSLPESSEGSDAGSTVWSEYTVKSVTSYNERRPSGSLGYALGWV